MFTKQQFAERKVKNMRQTSFTKQDSFSQKHFQLALTFERNYRKSVFFLPNLICGFASIRSYHFFFEMITSCSSILNLNSRRLDQRFTKVHTSPIVNLVPNRLETHSTKRHSWAITAQSLNVNSVPSTQIVLKPGEASIF